MNIASEIKKQSFARPSPELFDKVADEVARTIVEEGAGRANKATQIRKFYDELELWNERVQQAPNPQGKLDEVLPYILMLRAKC
ncbi:MAG: type III-A CRISPR-associated protein Csm2, partial [Deltaproteobacteria bacterium]|nr:type III-A CRISPR-associated protein Csm2 [Deltaproteobacteria bacterium]